MKCLGCNNEQAYRIHSGYLTNEKGEREKYEVCDKCGDFRNTTVADVYFREPYFDEHLADTKNPYGQFVNSKQHKAEILKQLNLRETGDIKNPRLGKVTPFIRDEKQRQKFFRDNFGEEKCH